jgi:hypothetical protein
LFLYVKQPASAYLIIYFNADFFIYPTATTEGFESDEILDVYLFDVRNYATLNYGINTMSLESSDSKYPIDTWYARIIAAFPVVSSQGLTEYPWWIGTCIKK